MTMQQRWAEGPNIGTPPRHQPTSTDHLINVLSDLRTELRLFCQDIEEYACDSPVCSALQEADAILKTYGR